MTNTINTINTEIDHKPQYATLRDKIRAEKVLRQGRDEKFAEIFAKAKQAGIEAGYSLRPRPIVVTQHTNPLNDNSPVEKAWYSAGGTCGFAWVNVRPATSAFARWLAKNKIGHRSYHGGWDIWISEHGQSVEQKEAHAHALSEVLKNELGITCYAASRLD